jgi:hypothetical protein
LNEIKKALRITEKGMVFIPKNAVIHHLKTISSQFENLWTYQKKHELRKDDRKFKTGDILVLEEIKNKKYTGRRIITFISHKLKNFQGLEKNYCILSIENGIKVERSNNG